MANFNKVILAGNLTRDPELRYTPKGTAIAQFGLAVNRYWTDEQGQKKEEVTFVDIEAWTRLAETAGKYLSKGSPVLIEGRLRQDTWEDKETKQKRSRIKVVAETMQFLSSPRNVEFQGGEGDSGGNPQARRQAPRSGPAPQQQPPPADDSGGEEKPKDDIPF